MIEGEEQEEEQLSFNVLDIEEEYEGLIFGEQESNLEDFNEV